MEKPKPNYLRDGIFIVVMLLAVLLFETFSGNSEEVHTYNVPKEKPAPAVAPAATTKPDPATLIQFAKPQDWTNVTDDGSGRPSRSRCRGTPESALSHYRPGWRRTR